MKKRRKHLALFLIITFISITFTKGQSLISQPIYLTDSVPQLSVDTGFHPAKYKPAVYRPENTPTFEPGKSDLNTLETNKLFADNKTFDKMLRACIDTDYESALHHIDKMSGKNLSAEQIGVLNEWKLFCLRKSNKFDDIVNMFTPGNVSMYFPANYSWVGYAFSLKERYIEATTYYELAGVLKGANVDRAFIYAAGLSYYSQANYEKAITYLNMYASVGGTDSSAFYYLGMANYFQAKYENAFDDLNKYSEKGGTYEGAYYYLGIIAYNLGKFEKCASYFDIYQQVKGKDIDVLFYSGLANYKFGKYDSAIAEFGRYLNRGGKNQTALLYLGYCSFLTFYANKGAVSKLDDAIKYYTKYISLLDAAKSNYRPTVYINRANAKTYKQDFAGAIADYDLQIKYTPNNVLPYELKANCYERMKNVSGAIDATEAAMKTFKDNSSLYNRRAWYKALNSSYGSALQDVERAISLDAKNGLAYCTKGFILMKQNQNAEAIACFDNAITLAPSPNAYYYRGVSKQQMNDIPGACSDWNKALEIKFVMDPNISNTDVEKMKAGYCR